MCTLHYDIRAQLAVFDIFHLIGIVLPIIVVFPWTTNGLFVLTQQFKVDFPFYYNRIELATRRTIYLYGRCYRRKTQCQKLEWFTCSQEHLYCICWVFSLRLLRNRYHLRCKWIELIAEQLKVTDYYQGHPNIGDRDMWRRFCQQRSNFVINCTFVSFGFIFISGKSLPQGNNKKRFPKTIPP